MNNFKTCDICEGINIDTLVPKLKELDKAAEIEIACHGFCGIGAEKPFVILNNIPIIKDTEEELIEEIKNKLKNQDCDKS